MARQRPPARTKLTVTGVEILRLMDLSQGRPAARDPAVAGRFRNRPLNGCACPHLHGKGGTTIRWRPDSLQRCHSAGRMMSRQQSIPPRCRQR
ncbi:hypothetical protein EVAR_101253_1 [Eumeta japonica]|uniref:Uncharacterized protein n=1 Tax=Eumeta variegata TaxID=151549 RepID=A0A4C1SN43_EUMVA|nr:hypothetical protein EVAR_101253_1 [Eumeta japonica]